jgi:hypothetical protein
LFAALWLLALWPVGASLGAAAPAEPRIVAVYPIGGQPGATFRAVVRGSNLTATSALWSEDEGLAAAVLGVAAEPPAADSKSKKAKPADLLEVEFRLAPGLRSGSHAFRVITPGGLSNPMELFVHEPPAILEKPEPHDLPRLAQAIASLPAAVHGRIAEVGEVDYYSFRVEAGEELLFRTVSSEALDPALAIYEWTGSWFDPERVTRLAFHDEDVAYPDLPTDAALRYRFEKAGEYLVRVNGFWGHGGPDQVYVLLVRRVAPDESEAPPDEPRKLSEWDERNWTRALDTARMRQLWSRAVPELAPQPSQQPSEQPADEASARVAAVAQEIPVIDADAEPSRAPVEPPVIPLPALVVGTIEHAGDIDRVRFSVKEGDRLAFEVETPDKTVPLMNPYLRVVDSEGVEALTNVYSRVNSNGNLSKQIQPKTQYAFPRAGDFTLEIRDITATYGDRAMRYRVLVRPQVPHLGEVRVAQDRLNLVAGEAQKLSIVTDQEEGYDGFALLTVEGLPAGVRAVMATEVEPEAPPPFNEGKKERFTTNSQKATFVFVSEPDAPATDAPVKGRVYAQPVVKGKLGPRILAKELWIMVLRQAAEQNRPAEAAEAR